MTATMSRKVAAGLLSAATSLTLASQGGAWAQQMVSPQGQAQGYVIPAPPQGQMVDLSMTSPSPVYAPAPGTSGSAIVTSTVAEGAWCDGVACGHGQPHANRKHGLKGWIHEISGDPRYFAEPPLGYYVRLANTRQIANAATDDFTFFRSDFIAGTTVLSPTGRDRLFQLSKRVHLWNGPIMIESVPESPRLNDARRNEVAMVLQRSGLPIWLDRILVIGAPNSAIVGPNGYAQYTNSASRYGQGPRDFALPPEITTNAGTSIGASGGGGS